MAPTPLAITTPEPVTKASQITVFCSTLYEFRASRMQASPPQINGYMVPSRSKLLMESPFIIRPINHIFGISNKISENSTVNNNCSTHVLTFKTSPLPRTIVQ
ncbi:hypothetical protein NC651_001194 [Populus alba x Populus x berolinensis]|nr:hypothetical protein NC651_001194 [Populus alba x Populus x berolinensis]